MARIKISIPEKFSFATEIPIRITDVNYGGHVGNDAILSIIHEARLRFLKHYGYSEMDLAGVGMIMADVAIEFKREAFYGDTVISSVTAADFGRVNFDLYYKLEKEQGGELVTVALARSGMICYDYSRKKICPVPNEVLTSLGD